MEKELQQFIESLSTTQHIFLFCSLWLLCGFLAYLMFAMEMIIKDIYMRPKQHIRMLLILLIFGILSSLVSIFVKVEHILTPANE